VRIRYDRQEPAQVMFLLSCVAAVAIGSESETIFYFGDPQIGFGKSGWRDDELRFASAAKSASLADAVVVAGDLVNVWNNSTLTGGFDWVWPAMFQKGKVHLVPGNHDVNSAGTNLNEFKSQLEHYHATFGRDYHSFTTLYATFIMVNSESLIAPALGLKGSRSDPWLVNQTETQWAWLESTLAAATTPHKIVVSHHPPFLKSPSETHVYWNWPLAIRPRLLSLLSKYGVQNMLCGHTHTTTNRTVNGLSIYTVAGTARAFDKNGCGYQVLRINSSHVHSEYVRQEDPAVEQCSPSLVHPDFEDQPNLDPDWADVRWLVGE